MKKLLPLLILLSLLSSCSLTSFLPGSGTSRQSRHEQRASRKLVRHANAIKKLLKEFPYLADSVETVVKDSLQIQSDSGQVKPILAKDTSNFNKKLERYVEIQEKIKYLKATSETKNSTANTILIHKLQTDKRILQDSLHNGAFRRDTVYTYEDAKLKMSIKLADGKLSAKYETKAKWILYDKQLITLGLHDCPPDVFYSHKEFWFANGFWLLVILILSLLRRLFR